MSLALTLKTVFLGKPSNERLMLNYAKTGDKTVLTQLYSACGDDLYHFVLTMSDHTLAKDICQTTWLKVIEKKHLYADQGHFKAWLFTLARNQLFDEYRKQKDSCSETEKLVSQAADMSDNISQHELVQTFSTALTSLPFEQREAFCLQQEGFSLQDISSMTHTNTETVKSRLRYAKNGIRIHMQKFGE